MSIHQRNTDAMSSVGSAVSLAMLPVFMRNPSLTISVFLILFAGLALGILEILGVLFATVIVFLLLCKISFVLATAIFLIFSSNFFLVWAGTEYFSVDVISWVILLVNASVIFTSVSDESSMKLSSFEDKMAYLFGLIFWLFGFGHYFEFNIIQYSVTWMSYALLILTFFSCVGREYSTNRWLKVFANFIFSSLCVFWLYAIFIPSYFFAPIINFFELFLSLDWFSLIIYLLKASLCLVLILVMRDINKKSLTFWRYITFNAILLVFFITLFLIYNGTVSKSISGGVLLISILMFGISLVTGAVKMVRSYLSRNS